MYSVLYPRTSNVGLYPRTSNAEEDVRSFAKCTLCSTLVPAMLGGIWKSNKVAYAKGANVVARKRECKMLKAHVTFYPVRRVPRTFLLANLSNSDRATCAGVAFLVALSSI